MVGGSDKYVYYFQIWNKHEHNIIISKVIHGSNVYWNTLYIYIYIYVCVCVCVYACVRVYVRVWNVYLFLVCYEFMFLFIVLM